MNVALPPSLLLATMYGRASFIEGLVFAVARVLSSRVVIGTRHPLTSNDSSDTEVTFWCWPESGPKLSPKWVTRKVILESVWNHFCTSGSLPTTSESLWSLFGFVGLWLQRLLSMLDGRTWPRVRCVYHSVIPLKITIHDFSPPNNNQLKHSFSCRHLHFPIEMHLPEGKCISVSLSLHKYTFLLKIAWGSGSRIMSVRAARALMSA